MRLNIDPMNLVTDSDIISALKSYDVYHLLKPKENAQTDNPIQALDAPKSSVNSHDVKVNINILRRDMKGTFDKFHICVLIFN